MYVYMYVYMYTCIHVCVCVFSKLQKLCPKTHQHINISRPLNRNFILSSTVSEDVFSVFWYIR